MAKVKVKKVNLLKDTASDSDIGQTVRDMIEGNIKIDVVHKKYTEILKHVERYIKVLQLFSKQCETVGLPGSAALLDVIDSVFKSEFSLPPLDKWLLGIGLYSHIPPEVSSKYIEDYKVAKSGTIVNNVMKTLHNLNAPNIKKYLVEKKDGSDAVVELRPINGVFIKTWPLMEWTPLDGFPVNVRQMYLLSDDCDQEFILLCIQKIYMICRDINNALNIPDIDPADFSRIVLNSLDDIKKHVPRCGDAFDKIKESVALLENNFGSYYKDFVKTDNPGIIIENFVTDVAKQSGNNIKLAKQFKDIIQFYKKMASQNMNPQMKALFNHVDKQFAHLNLGDDDEEEAAPSEN